MRLAMIKAIIRITKTAISTVAIFNTPVSINAGIASKLFILYLKIAKATLESSVTITKLIDIEREMERKIKDKKKEERER